MRLLFLMIYYGFAQHLPDSYSKWGGKFWNAIRIFCCRRIFKYCGKVSTINRHHISAMDEMLRLETTVALEQIALFRTIR